MGANILSYVHTSFSIDPEVMQAESAWNFYIEFCVRHDGTFVSLVSPRDAALAKITRFAFGGYTPA